MALTPAGGGHIQALRPTTTQTVSYTGSSAATGSVVNSRIVRLVSTTDCHIAIAPSPTATTSDMFLPSGAPEYFVVQGEGNDKVAAIRSSSDGTLYVTEMV